MQKRSENPPRTNSAGLQSRCEYEGRLKLASSDLTNLRVDGEDCRVLLTGREMKVPLALDATVIEVGGLLPEESRSLLSIRAGLSGEDGVGELADALSHLPLAIELAAYQIKAGLSPEELLRDLSREEDLLRALDVPGYERERDPEIARNLSLNACLNLSLRRLSEELLLYFTQLSVLRANVPFNSRVAAKVWSITNISQAAGALRKLSMMSLLSATSGDNASYSIHQFYCWTRKFWKTKSK
jgi:hypothetical protein